MRTRIASIIVVAIMLMACLVVGANAQDTQQDDSSITSAAGLADVNCTIQVLNVVCVEAGIVVFQQPISIPTVKVTVPGPTITLSAPPRATATVTRTTEVEVTGPSSTQTVRVTATAPAAPGATQTIREPGSTVTTTAVPTAKPTRIPTPTSTATVTVPGLSTATTITPAPGQEQTTSDTLDPGGDGLIPKNTTPVIVTGIGLGILALIAALIVLGMYGGYYIGYKDSDKADANFFRALLNKE